MAHEILVVFENEKILPEALLYAREFAVRVEARVTFLMLVFMSFDGTEIIGVKRNALRKIETRVGHILAGCAESFIQNGLEITTAMKAGDPAQELMKFLAVRSPFQAIVWGSGEDLPSLGKSGKGHWLRQAVAHLECPLLTVSRRSKEK